VFEFPPAGTLEVGTTPGLWVRLQNFGPASAGNVTVHFPVPAGYTVFQGPFLNIGSYDSTTGDWTISSLCPAVAGLSCTARVNGNGALPLTATITASSAPDPDLSNNTTTAPVNGRPVANAGADQTVATRSTVLLDGSLSTDFDGDPFTFVWSFFSRP